MSDAHPLPDNLPVYRCHRLFRTVKIAAVDFEADHSAKITPAEEGVAPFMVAPGFAYHGDENDHGFLVVEPDGGLLWLSSAQVEDAYSRVA